MSELIDEFYQKTPAVLSEAKALLPKNFPKSISDAIFNGVENAARRLAL
ncbi:type II toxin-antitoxin system HipA family toxin [Cedecea lapagei]|nr:type II toxin-antitoxin system HipA family toxin [Cedecea lapagei]